MANKTKEPKILLFDIESSNLNANFGIIFCVGYKWLGEKKVHMISIRDDKNSFSKDPTLDKSVVSRFAEVLKQADVVVGHYSTRFDIKMLQSKCLEHQLPPLPPVTHVDTWRMAKETLKLNSNRLEAISRYLPYTNQKNAPRKTPIENKAWIRAVAGHVPSLKQIEHHCEMDILVLEDVYTKLKPYSKTHPNLAKLKDDHREGCPSCGGFHTTKQGFKLTLRKKQQRYQCQDCAHWFTLNK